MQRFTRLSLAALGATLSACAMDGAPVEPVAPVEKGVASAVAEDPPETARLKVAETVAAGGQTFKFYELGQGKFAISQSAPVGTMPMVVDQALWDEGDPAKIFHAISPDRPVPEALTAALARLGMAPAPESTTSAPTAADAVVARRATQTRPVETKLADTPAAAAPAATGGLVPATAIAPAGDEPAVRSAITFSTQTGAVNCQTTFDFLQVNGDLFCPASNGTSQCWHDAGSSIWQNSNAIGGYSAVCAIGGTPRLNLITSNSAFPGVGFDVPSGTWRYIKLVNVQECHTSGFCPFCFTSCSKWSGFVRWEVPAAAGNWYHQGVWITPK
jgi:hypothetical protein